MSGLVDPLNSESNAALTPRRGRQKSKSVGGTDKAARRSLGHTRSASSGSSLTSRVRKSSAPTVTAASASAGLGSPQFRLTITDPATGHIRTFNALIPGIVPSGEPVYYYFTSVEHKLIQDYVNKPDVAPALLQAMTAGNTTHLLSVIKKALAGGGVQNHLVVDGTEVKDGVNNVDATDLASVVEKTIGRRYITKADFETTYRIKPSSSAAGSPTSPKAVMDEATSFATTDKLTNGKIDPAKLTPADKGKAEELRTKLDAIKDADIAPAEKPKLDALKRAFSTVASTAPTPAIAPEKLIEDANRFVGNLGDAKATSGGEHIVYELLTRTEQKQAKEFKTKLEAIGLDALSASLKQDHANLLNLLSKIPDSVRGVEKYEKAAQELDDVTHSVSRQSFVTALRVTNEMSGHGVDIVDNPNINVPLHFSNKPMVIIPSVGDGLLIVDKDKKVHYFDPKGRAIDPRLTGYITDLLLRNNLKTKTIDQIKVNKEVYQTDDINSSAHCVRVIEHLNSEKKLKKLPPLQGSIDDYRKNLAERNRAFVKYAQDENKAILNNAKIKPKTDLEKELKTINWAGGEKLSTEPALPALQKTGALQVVEVEYSSLEHLGAMHVGDRDGSLVDELATHTAFAGEEPDRLTGAVGYRGTNIPVLRNQNSTLGNRVLHDTVDCVLSAPIALADTDWTGNALTPTAKTRVQKYIYNQVHTAAAAVKGRSVPLIVTPPAWYYELSREQKNAIQAEYETIVNDESFKGKFNGLVFANCPVPPVMHLLERGLGEPGFNPDQMTTPEARKTLDIMKKEMTHLEITQHFRVPQWMKNRIGQLETSIHDREAKITALQAVANADTAIIAGFQTRTNVDAEPNKFVTLDTLKTEVQAKMQAIQDYYKRGGLVEPALHEQDRPAAREAAHLQCQALYGIQETVRNKQIELMEGWKTAKLNTANEADLAAFRTDVEKQIQALNAEKFISRSDLNLTGTVARPSTVAALGKLNAMLTAVKQRQQAVFTNAIEAIVDRANLNAQLAAHQGKLAGYTTATTFQQIQVDMDAVGQLITKIHQKSSTIQAYTAQNPEAKDIATPQLEFLDTMRETIHRLKYQMQLQYFQRLNGQISVKLNVPELNRISTEMQAIQTANRAPGIPVKANLQSQITQIAQLQQALVAQNAHLLNCKNNAATIFPENSKNLAEAADLLITGVPNTQHLLDLETTTAVNKLLDLIVLQGTLDTILRTAQTMTIPELTANIQALDQKAQEVTALNLNHPAVAPRLSAIQTVKAKLEAIRALKTSHDAQITAVNDIRTSITASDAQLTALGSANNIALNDYTALQGQTETIETAIADFSRNLNTIAALNNTPEKEAIKQAMAAQSSRLGQLKVRLTGEITRVKGTIALEQVKADLSAKRGLIQLLTAQITAPLTLTTIDNLVLHFNNLNALNQQLRTQSEAIITYRTNLAVTYPDLQQSQAEKMISTLLEEIRNLRMRLSTRYQTDAANSQQFALNSLTPSKELQAQLTAAEGAAVLGKAQKNALIALRDQEMARVQANLAALPDLERVTGQQHFATQAKAKADPEWIDFNLRLDTLINGKAKKDALLENLVGSEP